jgi:hypothetical protein
MTYTRCLWETDLRPETEEKQQMGQEIVAS